MAIANEVHVRKVFTAESLSSGGTATTTTIYDLGDLAQNGSFGFHYEKTGSGVVKVEYLLSDIHTGTFITPSTALDIVPAIAAGTQSDIDSFIMPPARFCKFKLTEDGTNSAVVTLWIAFD